MAYVREYWEGDAELLAPLLRDADRREIQAASGLSPVESLRQGAEESEIVCSIVGETVCGMFGVSPSYQNAGYVWLLGSDELVTGRAKRQFIRNAGMFLTILHKYFPLLHNYVDKRNTVHIRWLRRMGFTFIAEHPEFGHEKRPFLEFVRLR